MTVEEAAQMLGIGRSLGYELVRRGEIRSIKLGRRVLIPRQVLAALLSGEGGVE